MKIKFAERIKFLKIKWINQITQSSLYWEAFRWQVQRKTLGSGPSMLTADLFGI